MSRRAEREPLAERHRDVTRVEAFSDGVFAFAATLLALGIRIPRPDDADASVGLYQLILALWPSFFAFALSFITVGIVWANHHVMFGYFVRADRGLVTLNLLVLMLVAFLPVPTAVLGSWLASDGERRTAVIFYAATLVLFGVVHDILWWYGAYHKRATAAELSARERRSLTIGWLVGPVLYLFTIALAAIDPRLSIAGFVLIHAIYILPTGRLVLRAQRARAVRG